MKKNHPVTAYGELARLVTRRLALSDFYARAHAILASCMDAANCFVALRRDEGLAFPYFVDETDDENALPVYPVEGWSALVLESARSLALSRDAAAFCGRKPVGRPAEDWIGAPLVDRDGGCFGVLVVQSYRKGARYSEGDIRLVEFAAAQASLAIQLLHIDIDCARRRIEGLEEAGVEGRELYAGIHAVIASLIPAADTSCIIAAIDHASEEIHPVFWRDPFEDFRGLRWRLDEGLSGYLCSGAADSYLYETGVTAPPEGWSLLGRQPAYWLGAAIRNHDAVIGIVMIQSHDPASPLTKEDESVLSGLCPPIARAIAKSKLPDLLPPI